MLIWNTDILNKYNKWYLAYGILVFFIIILKLRNLRNLLTFALNHIKLIIWILLKNAHIHTQKKLVDDDLEEILEAEFIDGYRSFCGFPVVLVEKGDKRFCIDFRVLNKIAQSNAHPLRLMMISYHL